MTCLVQWAVALAAFVLLNRWMVRKTLHRSLASTS
jgi:hypothetical protein